MKLVFEGTEDELIAFAKKLTGVKDNDMRLASGYKLALKELSSGHKIAAVKIHRNLVGCTLKEALEYVETL